MRQTLAIPMVFALVVSLLVFPVTNSYGQAPAAASQISEFDVNGLKVLIKRRLGTPTVAAGLFFRGGVRNVTADNAGIEGFALSVATEATKNYPRQKLRKETSSAATVISSGANYDYSVLALACTKPSFESAWKIFVDVALNPTFAPGDVDRVREGLLTGLRGQTDSPEGSLETLNDAAVFAGHPYRNAPEGTIATIAKLNAADLKAYHQKMLETSRMLLVIVGDVEPAALQTRIASSFANVPRGEYKEKPLPAIEFAKSTVDITEKGVQTDYVKGTFAAPSIRDPDYYAMRAAITILQTQVFQEVRNKRNLSYAPDATLDERSANTASISVSSVSPTEAVAVMLGEIRKLKQGSVDEDTLAQMSGFFLTTHYLKQETNGAQAAELAQYELIGGGWRRSLEFLDRLRAVTPDQVRAVANKYMKNLRFSVVGDPRRIDRSVLLQEQN